MFARNPQGTIRIFNNLTDEQTSRERYRSGRLDIYMENGKKRNVLTVFKHRKQNITGLYRILEVAFHQKENKILRVTYGTYRPPRYNKCSLENKSKNPKSLKDLILATLHKCYQTSKIAEMLLCINLERILNTSEKTHTLPPELVEEIQRSFFTCAIHYYYFENHINRILRQLYLCLKLNYQTPLLYMITPNSPLAIRAQEDSKTIMTAQQIQNLVTIHRISNRHASGNYWCIDQLADSPEEKLIWIAGNPTKSTENITELFTWGDIQTEVTSFTYNTPRLVQFLDLQSLLRLSIKMIQHLRIKPEVNDLITPNNLVSPPELKIGHITLTLKDLLNNPKIADLRWVPAI